MWEIIKTYFYTHTQHLWLENHLLYAAILGFIIISFLYFVYIKKIKKQIKNSEDQSRKNRRNIIKLLGKKNKTR